ncbi:MAG: nucleoside deaminase [Pseudomonadota bacterium]|nr:nucleoside deaminase [Pseudomonadota bacterium]
MTTTQQHTHWMRVALEQAEIAGAQGEVPVGAVLVLEQKLIAAAGNAVERSRDATQHAELRVITQASAKLSSWRLLRTTLYCTLEPCAMCLAAIKLARIPTLVFAANDTSRTITTMPSVHAGVCAEESSGLLRKFFQDRRHA